MDNPKNYLIALGIYLVLVISVSFIIRFFGDYAWFRYRVFVKGDSSGLFEFFLGAFMSPGTGIVKLLWPVKTYKYGFDEGGKKIKYVPKPD